MIATYASAALICAVSLLVGRAVLTLAGRREWSWLEPAVGFGAVLTVTGLLARAPGHATSATLGLAVLIPVAALILWRAGVRPLSGQNRQETNAGTSWREGLPVAIVIALVLAIPFAVSGRWGLLGVGFNNDLGLHLAWAEWLRSGFGPEPDPGYPLGPHGLAVATAVAPGVGLGQAFLGEIVAIAVMTGLTALGALRTLTPARRTIAATLVALPYLAASYYAQAAFKELAEALLVLAFAVWLTTFDSQSRGAPSPDTQHRARRDVSGVGAPLTRPLRVAWTVLTVAFVAGAVYSSFLALRDAPVGPAGHGSELEAFLPILHGRPVLYAGQDRYAAYELLGADTHVPLVEFPDDAVSPNPEKPFDTGDAYSPIDFDSFSRGTLDRHPYVITGRAAWNSQAPPNFKRVDSTASYVLWKQTGPTPEDRHVLLEGTEAGAFAGCAAPEIRILLAGKGRAGLFPDAVIGQKGDWEGGSILGTGAETSQTLRLPAGSWNLSLQYFSPFDLTLSAPGFNEELKAALDGQRPNTISLGNNGQPWPAGRYESKGGSVRFTISTEDASTLQSLSGYTGKAYIGELVAVPAEPHRTVPLAAACDQWIDWYEAAAAP
jgi:Ca2+/Na+ antiporter